MIALGRPVLAVLLAAAATFVSAGEPSSRPQLRIEGGMHTAAVAAVDVDATRNRAVTVSLDKTIRVWQLPEWKLRRVIRVPAEGINEGKLTTVALSPDGTHIIAGGWTCWEWQKTGCLYVFDASSGNLVRRIAGLPAIATTLSFSEDGLFLAVGMDGRGGLRFYNGKSFDLLKQDQEYGGKVSFAGYSLHDNSVVTASDDGYLRTYDPSMRLVVRQRVPSDGRLGAANFSPDNRRIVLGFQDKPHALVMTYPGMVVEKQLDADGVPGQLGLCCVAWSLDGTYLHGYGRNESVAGTPMFRWEDADLAKRTFIMAAGQRIEAMFTMKDGSLVYVTEDPAFGVLDASGQRVKYIEPAIAQFRFGHERFGVSHDGAEVFFPVLSGQTDGVFSLERLNYRTAATSQQSKQVPTAARSSRRFRLQGWENRSDGRLNGVALPTQANEIARSYVISPDDTRMLLGTEWGLWLINEAGHVMWHRETPGVAWNVNISGDGRFAVASYGDGTIRWHKMSDGEEVAALFVHRNGKDWVLWRPDGYYASSEEGDRFVGWHVNRGMDTTPDFYLAQQFERIFFRPDLLRSVLAPDLPATRSVGGERFSIERIDEIAPPSVSIASATPVEREGRMWLDLDLRVRNKVLPARELSVFVNGIPVLAQSQRALQARDHLELRLTVPVAAINSEIRVEAFNGQAMGVAEETISAPFRAVGPRLGDLYLVAIGANEFPLFKPAQNVDLEFASRDAQELGRLLTAQAGKQFRSVNTLVLGDGPGMRPASLANLRDSLKHVAGAGPDDTVIVFLASHGFSDRAGNYYFVPRDGSPAEVDALHKGTLASEQVMTLLSWQEIFDNMRNAAGRRFLIVDTCHAEGVIGKFDAHSLKKRSASSLFGLLVASQFEEKAQEYREGGQGLFTFALLEALSGRADADGDGQVTLQESFDYVKARVEELRDRAFPQTPDLMAPSFLRYAPLTRESVAGKR